MRKFKFIGIILALFLLFGCATTGDKPLSPEDSHKVALMNYDRALKWYTKNARIYEIHYQAAPDDIKAKWKAEIDPVFLDAKDALDTWKKIVMAGGIDADAEAGFEEQYTKLMLMGLEFLEDK